MADDPRVPADLVDLAVERAGEIGRHYPHGDRARVPFGELIPDPTASAEASVDLLAEREWVRGAVADLPDRLRLVITLYYFGGLYLHEIGSILGVTESRTSQLHSAALHRLRMAMRADLAA